MLFPSITEYRDALKDGGNVFATQKHLNFVPDEYGEPYRKAGGFSVVFKMKDTATGKHYALKCFHKPKDNLIESYRLISQHLQQYDSPYLVRYHFLENEMRVESDNCNETTFPVLVMDWVEGKTLREAIKDWVAKDSGFHLTNLAQKFETMALWLLAQPFSHTDLKTENIMLTDTGQLVLVDYDGIYVPAMQGQLAREEGTAGYGHPKRIPENFNQHSDDFTILLISLSLRLIARRPQMFTATQSDENLLFTHADLADLQQSKLYQQIWDIAKTDASGINVLVSLLQMAVSGEDGKIVMLETLLSSMPVKKRSGVDEEIVDFFTKDFIPVNFFIELISINHALSDELREKYKDKWNWGGLSENPALPWSTYLIETYKDKWNWSVLSRNRSLLWSLDLLEKYRDKWDWSGLSRSSSFPWSLGLLKKYEDKWDWSKLSKNPSLPWILDLLEKYEDKWDWRELSNNPSLPWNLGLLEKYEDKWDWEPFGLSYNRSLPWNRELIEKYKDKWNWGQFGLSENPALPWSTYLIETYKDKWNWSELSRNRSLLWSLDLLEKYLDKWDWSGLSRSSSFPWSLGLLKKYEDKWDWNYLSNNKSLPWSLELVEKYKDRWNWNYLSNNKSLPWSISLIIKYNAKWGWRLLGFNESVYEKVFKERLNDATIEAIMKSI